MNTVPLIVFLCVLSLYINPAQSVLSQTSKTATFTADGYLSLLAQISGSIDKAVTELTITVTVKYGLS